MKCPRCGKKCIEIDMSKEYGFPHTKITCSCLNDTL